MKQTDRTESGKLQHAPQIALEDRMRQIGDRHWPEELLPNAAMNEFEHMS